MLIFASVNEKLNPKQISIMANLSDFRVGDVLLTYGLDMSCHKCVCKTEITEINDEGIVTKSEECDYMIITTWENMKYANDYFLYSPKQEKAMQDYCDNAYNEWVAACRRQAEEAHRHHLERNEKLKSLIKAKGGIVILSGKNDFYRWRPYVIVSINEKLDVLGVAEDNSTMSVSLDDLCVPTQQSIKSEIEAA